MNDHLLLAPIVSIYCGSSENLQPIFEKKNLSIQIRKNLTKKMGKQEKQNKLYVHIQQIKLIQNFIVSLTL